MTDLNIRKNKSYKPTRERKRKRRLDQKTFIDESEQKKIKLVTNDDKYHGYDESNELVLPSSKRHTVVQKKQHYERILSKKHKKKLTKIIELKGKKLQRESLLKELKEFQATPEELAMLTTLQESQTLGRKVFSNPNYLQVENATVIEEGSTKQRIAKRNLGRHWSGQTKAERRERCLKEEADKKELRNKYRPKMVNCGLVSSDEDNEDELIITNNDEKEKTEVDQNTSCGSSEIVNKNNDQSEINTTDKSINENIQDFTIEKKLKKGKKNKKVMQKEENVIRKNKKNKKIMKNLEINSSCELEKYHAGTDVSIAHKIKVCSKEKNLKDKKMKKDKLTTEERKENKLSKKESLKRKKRKLNKEDTTTVKAKNKKKNIINTGNLDDNSFCELENCDSEISVQATKEQDSLTDKKVKKKKLTTQKMKKNKLTKHDSVDIDPKEVNINLESVAEVTVEKNASVSVVENKEHPKRTVKFLDRDENIKESRLKLPILSEEHTVMEAINENPAVLIVGNTGSGKTTQVPQFLYEAGFTSTGQMIGVTEPRRVAAIAMSKRVATEMNVSSRQVSYQVRFEGNVTKDTEIKFMTDGILLKEIQSDDTLMKYSAIIIDEAHERNVRSDILIGLLSLIVRLREKMNNPLKLIIMSATLRTEDFINNRKLFPKNPPIINIDSSLFTVDIHYSPETKSNYLVSAYEQVSKIHRKLPDGTILVFVTGQSEVFGLLDLLAEEFESPEQYEERQYQKRRKEQKMKREVVIPQVNLSEFIPEPNSLKPHEYEIDEDITEMVEDDEFFNCKDFDDKSWDTSTPLKLLPLYAMLPAKEQQKVFNPPPPGCRLCVITTNVAETSLTIPNVKYVVDSGKVKQKIYDPVTGVSSFKIVWTSKAAATQRTGRAGRVSNGHCYRLYSSAVYEHELPEYMEPEILRRPIEDIVLTLKTMGITIGKFALPTPPSEINLINSYKNLFKLGALEFRANTKVSNEYVKTLNCLSITANDVLLKTTDLGNQMSLLPVAPHYAKMILRSASIPGATDYFILIIAALTYPEVIQQISIGYKGKPNSGQIKKMEHSRVAWGGTGLLHTMGDILVFINAVKNAELHNGDALWCEENGISQRDFFMIQKLRRQIANTIHNVFDTGITASKELTLVPLTVDLTREIGKIMLNSCYQFVAKKVDYFSIVDPTEKNKWKHAYKCMNSSDPVFIHGTSVVRTDRPDYVIYQDIYTNATDNKTYIKYVSIVAEFWLPVEVPHMCTFTPAMDKPEPTYLASIDRVVCHRGATFGPHKWILSPCEVNYPEGNELFKWVAYLFLEGKIIPALAKYKEDIYKPTSLFTTCYRGQQLGPKLIGLLKSRNITCRTDLENIWKSSKKESMYLLQDYCKWFKDQTCDGPVPMLVEKNWPGYTNISKD